MHRNDITDEFINSLIKSDSKELTLEIAEFTVDQLIDDSLLKDIPIVGWLFRVKQAYSNITDKIYLAKLSRFLLSLSTISSNEKENLKEKLKDNTDRVKIGNSLLLILDKLSDLEKSEIMAKVFMAYVNSEITFDEFISLGTAVELAFIEDLKFLKDNNKELSTPFRKIDPFTESSYQRKVNRLLRCGLAEITSSFSIATRVNQSQVDIPINVSHLGIILSNILSGELYKKMRI